MAPHVSQYEAGEAQASLALILMTREMVHRGDVPLVQVTRAAHRMLWERYSDSVGSRGVHALAWAYGYLDSSTLAAMADSKYGPSAEQSEYFGTAVRLALETCFVGWELYREEGVTLVNTAVQMLRLLAGHETHHELRGFAWALAEIVNSEGRIPDALAAQWQPEPEDADL